LIRSGEIGPRDLIWTEGMPSWKPLIELPELGAGAALPPAAASPPVLPPSERGEARAQADFGASSESPYAPPAVNLGGASPPGPALPVTNGLAIASLICGVLSLVFFCFCGGVFFGVPAVICGHLAGRQLKAEGNQQEGRGMAVAGLICGYIGLLVFAMIMLGGEWNIEW